MQKASRRPRRLSALLVAVIAAALVASAVGLAANRLSDNLNTDDILLNSGAKPPLLDEESEQELLARDFAFESRRTAGDTPLSGIEAGQLRGAAARSAAQARKAARKAAPAGPTTFGGSWTSLGPSPISEVTPEHAGHRGHERPYRRPRDPQGRNLDPRWRPRRNLGARADGIGRVPKTDNLPSLAIGALAIAPTNDNVIYAGTGEGALSGDSYTGNGILKSTDGGNTWTQVSGDYFMGVSISRLVVDPTNASHLYAAVLRGRGGARRVSPPVHSRFGIWESTDGGVNWTLRREVPEKTAPPDLEIDPQNPKILYASFWSDKIYRSTNGGLTWTPFMTGLPDADYAAETTRFSIAISHTSPTGPVTLYAGFGYDGRGGARLQVDHRGRQVEHLAGWSGADSVFDYCAEQCSYDNVIEVDPHNANIVYAGGQFNYAIGSGGIFRFERRRWDVAEPRLGSASGLPRVRVRSKRLRQHSRRQRRRRLVQ